MGPYLTMMMLMEKKSVHRTLATAHYDASSTWRNFGANEVLKITTPPHDPNLSLSNLEAFFTNSRNQIIWYLPKFFKELKKQDGQPYPPKCLRHFFLVQILIKDLGLDLNLQKDEEFSETGEILELLFEQMTLDDYQTGVSWSCHSGSGKPAVSKRNFGRLEPKRPYGDGLFYNRKTF